jgi:hypothetical protein
VHGLRIGFEEELAAALKVTDPERGWEIKEELATDTVGGWEIEGVPLDSARGWTVEFEEE